MWTYLLILLAVALVATLVGYKNYIWFLSVGYGLAVAALGAALLILFAPALKLVTVLACIVFIAYGCRLAGFLLYRELKSKSYKKGMEGEVAKTVPIFVMVVMWIAVSILYVLQVSPVFSRLYNGSDDVVLPLVGVVISIVGVVIEALADIQKSAQKRENPKMVAMKGLYRMVRCPNYFGEILMWTGVFVGGLSTYTGFFQWFAAIFSFICIVYIMLDGAKRLEKRQNKRYGADPVYQAYVKKTPIILPLIPLYHLAGSKEEKK